MPTIKTEGRLPLRVTQDLLGCDTCPVRLARQRACDSRTDTTLQYCFDPPEPRPCQSLRGKKGLGIFQRKLRVTKA